MAKCDSAAVYIELCKVKAKGLTNSDRLRSESFVSFDKVEVSDLHACLIENFVCSSDRTKAHNFRLNATESACYPCCHRCDAQFFSLFFAHYYNGCSTVVDTGGITCCNDTVFLECWFQLGERFRSRASTWAFVCVEDPVAFLSVMHRNAYDFFFESAVFLSCNSLLLRSCSKLIKLLTVYWVVAILSLSLFINADVFSCDTHVVVIESIPKSVVYHCVNKVALAHRIAHTIAIAALHHSERSHGHILCTACYNDVSVASLDHLSSHVYAVETGAAYYVNRNGGNLDGKTSLDGCLTCNVLSRDLPG